MAAAAPDALPALPVEFGPINAANVGQLKKLNCAILPVRYNERFYTDVTAYGDDLCKFAIWNGFVVGAICTRLEPIPADSPVPAAAAEGGQRAYIMTLGVLPAYRGRQIGRRLLQSVVDACKRRPGVEQIMLHVQTNNQSAIDFYAHFDFQIGETVDNYYKRIEPSTAYVLRHMVSSSGASGEVEEGASGAEE